jgi:hypothetical protein
MFAEQGPLYRYVACPHCGLLQKVTFIYDEVSIEQRCIGCHRFAWFKFPSPYLKLRSWFNARKR